MTIRITLSIAITAFFGLRPAPANGSDWLSWRGPNADGIAAESLPANPEVENLIWKRHIGEGYSSFAVKGDQIIASGHDEGKEFVYSLRTIDAKVNWTFSYPAKQIARLHKGGPSSSPVIDANCVYLVSKDGLMHCLNLKDGAVIWKIDLKTLGGIKKPPEWGYAGSPVIVGNLVFVESGKTFALDKTTGKTVWASDDFEPSYGTAAFFKSGDVGQLAILKTDGLVILDAASGETLAFSEWKTSFSTNATTPIVIGNEIFISTGYKRGCALFRWEDGTLTKVYENKLMSNHMNNAVLVDGVLCGFDGNSHMGKPTEFAGIDWSTGEQVFRVPKNRGLGCGSVIADQKGRLIILSERGELAIAKAGKSGFQMETRAQVIGGRCWTPPVLSDGRVFVPNAEGSMVAVDLKKR